MHLPMMSKVAGFIANISSNVAFLPQIIKSYRRKRVEDVSIGMFFILFSTQVCWILYAVPIGAKNLWISSLIEIVLLLPLFAMWFKYKKPRTHSLPDNVLHLPLNTVEGVASNQLKAPIDNAV
jgi:MtN3 and saliva related transmembrane protein